MTVLVWLFIAYCLDRAQLIISQGNYGARWNGIGAVPGVLNRETEAPQAYRVLIPWLMRPWFKQAGDKLTWRVNYAPVGYYDFLKIILITGALLSVEYLFGWQVAMVTAVLLPATFYFDYWDWSGEMIGICLCATGILPLAILGVVIHGLSKETVLIDPLVFALAILSTEGGDFQFGQIGLVACAGAITWISVRAWAGKKPLYCDRVMLRRNVKEIKEILTYRPFYLGSPAVSIVLCLAALGLGWLAGPTYLFVPLMIAAGYTLAVASETRVFASVLPWLAFGLVKVLGG